MITACGTAERLIEDLKTIDTERKRTPEKSGTLATNLAGIPSSNRMGEKDEGLPRSSPGNAEQEFAEPQAE